MRMKFLRILPETCARTWCLFSSSTLNMALGNGSITTAITSIASSLLIQLLKSVVSTQSPSDSLLCQNHWPTLRDCHTVFEVSAVTTVSRYRCPLIVKDARFVPAYIHHRLD